jgi:hypothetical protein
MLVILLLVSKMLLGFTITHFLWRERRFWALILKIFIAIPLGMGLSSLFFYAWLWLVLPRLIYPWFEIFLTVVLFMILFWRSGLPLPSDAPALPKDLSGRFFLFFALAAVLVGVIFFTAYSIKFPHGFFEDAWIIWNMAARFIYRSADWTLMFKSQSALFHPDYPLLLSLNIVQGWLINPGETTRVPILVAALFTFSVPGILFAALMLLKDLKQASLAVFLLLMTPWFVMHGTEQVGDVPISAYFLSAAVCLLLYLRQRDPALCILSGLMAGLSAWTKNEGLYFWLSSAFVCLLIAVWVDKKPRAVWAFLSGSLLPLATVLLFKLFLAPGSDLFQNNSALLAKLIDPMRYGMIFTEFGRYISGFGGWPLGIFWILVLYAIVTGFEVHDRRELFLMALLPVLQLAGYFSIYLITPHDLDWHLTTSFGRLLMQIFPLALFVLMVALKSPAKSLPGQSLLKDTLDQ